MIKDNRVFLFDLGRVIIDFDHRIAVGKIKKYCSLAENDIYDLFFDSNITDRFEKGKLSPQDFYREIKNMLKIDISYEEFAPIWNEIFTPHPGMLEVLETLKNGYSLYMVSNINQMHYEYLKDKFSQYFKYFKHIFLSYELGLRKPDPRIYEYIINKIKFMPKDIIYIDDRPELINSAKTIGIDAFVFNSTSDLIKELAKRDIKLDQACPQITSPR